MLFRTRLSRLPPQPVLRSLSDGAKIATNAWRWGPLVRLVLLAIFAVGACIWALVGHFSPKPVTVRPAPSAVESETLIDLLP
jgi:hypothetical protein